MGNKQGGAGDHFLRSKKFLPPPQALIREGGRENAWSINRTASKEAAFLKISLGIGKPFTLSN